MCSRCQRIEAIEQKILTFGIYIKIAMKIICVGRNYSEHAKELGNALPENPIIFIKPDTALLKDNAPFYIPDFSQDIHYECELIFRISREGKHIEEQFVSSYLDGVGLGIDFTARDLQTELKSKGLPWTLAKAFNHSAPVSEFLPMNLFPQLDYIRFDLSLNGELRQQGNSKQMTYSLPYLVSFISRYMTLRKGDIIFTGTPAGVGPVAIGDRLIGRLEGREMLNFEVK